MKKLILFNFVFVFIVVMCFWAFTLFAHGVFVNSAGLVAGILCGFASLPLFLLGIPILVIINIYCLFKFWDDYKLITLLPFMIIGIGYQSLGIWNVTEMSIKRFKKYQPDYEAFVSKLVEEHKQGEWDNMLKMPPQYKHLAHWVTVYGKEPNDMFASFMVGYFGTFGHTSILYSSKGEIAPDSYTAKDWPDKQRINEHWFRVSD